MSYDAALLFYMLLIVYSPETSKQSRVPVCPDAVVRHGTSSSIRLSRLLASGSLSSVKHDDGTVCFELKKRLAYPATMLDSGLIASYMCT
jgi:hypothetical protein